MNDWAKIICIYGCMFSGKTTEMFRRVNTARIAGKNVIFIKPSNDTRTPKSFIVARNPKQTEKAIILPVLDPSWIEVFVSDYDLICIDEGQFWYISILSVLARLSKKGKRIIITGLDTNFRGEPFHPMPSIMAISDELIQVKAVCTVCKNFDATRTQRLIAGKPAPYKLDEIAPGGLMSGEMYEPRCRRCFEPPEGGLH